MSRRARAERLFLPWAALSGAALGWFGSQQIGSNLSFDKCASSGALAVLLIGVAGLALAGMGAWLSWGVWGSAEEESRRFTAGVGMLAGVLLGIAILFQTLAGFIIPACFA
jgi:hypothetical protein